MSCDLQPVFSPYNKYAPINIYRRNLPHWRQDGATYFVTFRLGDSIPRRVIQRWEYEDITWMRANGIEGPLRDPKWRKAYDALPEALRAAYEKRSAHRVHMELDQCHGACLFREKCAREVLSAALRRFHGERWWVGDFVIMPNHVHGLFLPIGEYALERILQSVKSYGATHLREADIRTEKGKLWQQESYDRLVRDREELNVWRRYIKENPAKAGLREGEYTYHRCRWLDEEQQ